MSQTIKRLTCPVCGNNNPKHIREVDDRTQPLYFYKTTGKDMYAKKLVCTDCRFEWR